MKHPFYLLVLPAFMLAAGCGPGDRGDAGAPRVPSTEAPAPTATPAAVVPSSTPLPEAPAPRPTSTAVAALPPATVVPETGSASREELEAALRLPPPMVKLPGKPLEIGKFEVTQAQWTQVMSSNPSQLKGDNLPVTHISWVDCHAFLEKLNGLQDAGGPYRLPTGEEWEYAYLAGSEGEYFYKDGPAGMQEYGLYAASAPAPVGERKPNAWGIHDIAGNVWEWCEDEVECHLEQFRTAGASCRMLRGGSFTAPSADRLRLGYMLGVPHQATSLDFGLRLVRDATAEVAPPSHEGAE